jgi:hypothetical protein
VNPSLVFLTFNGYCQQIIAMGEADLPTVPRPLQDEATGCSNAPINKEPYQVLVRFLFVNRAYEWCEP